MIDRTMTYIAISALVLVLAFALLLFVNALCIRAGTTIHMGLLARRREPIQATLAAVERTNWFRYRAIFEPVSADPRLLHGGAESAVISRYFMPVTAVFRAPDRALIGEAMTVFVKRADPTARAVCPPLHKFEIREATRLSSILLCILAVGFLSVKFAQAPAHGLGLDARLEIAGRLIVCATEQNCQPHEALEHYVLERCERQTVRTTCEWPNPRPP
ncbi:MAG: hypothetical protein AAFY64_10975, partial [Pseudomonadota bacterium]